MSLRLTREVVRRALVLRREQEAPVSKPKLVNGVALAAVAAILSPLDPLELLLIKRAVSQRDPWSAHMAFPGGKHELEDASLLDTAARETHEELGVDLHTSAEYLGPLPPQSVNRQRGQLQIMPFVFALRHLPELKPNHEVDQVLWVALDSLADGSRETSVVHDLGGQRLRFPAWDVQGQPVWGLTYRMTQSLLALLKGTPDG